MYIYILLYVYILYLRNLTYLYSWTFAAWDNFNTSKQRWV
jgi:hypothetical protein